MLSLNLNGVIIIEGTVHDYIKMLENILLNAFFNNFLDLGNIVKRRKKTTSPKRHVICSAFCR